MDGLNSVLDEIRSAHRTLYILCGYPYAGKSHIARIIVQETGTALVSIDDILRSYGFDWTTGHLPDAGKWQEIFDESFTLTRKDLTSGRNVLYDSTNHTLASRDRLREVANSVGADARVILITSGTEAIWDRWKASTQNLDRPTVSKELVEETIASFEAPNEKESVLLIRN